MILLEGEESDGKNAFRKKGYTYLDTGAMYRTVALKAIRSGIDTFDGDKLSKLIKNIDIELVITDNKQHMYLDKECVDDLIRTNQISKVHLMYQNFRL